MKVSGHLPNAGRPASRGDEYASDRMPPADMNLALEEMPVLAEKSSKLAVRSYIGGAWCFRTLPRQTRGQFRSNSSSTISAAWACVRLRPAML
jgi:hypothetical protein